MTEVEVKGVGVIEFPDSMTQEQITSALRRDFPPGIPNKLDVQQEAEQTDKQIARLGVAENVASAVYEPVRAVGQSLGVAGKVLGGIASDVGTAWQQGRFPTDFPATAEVLAGRPNPVAEDLKQRQGVEASIKKGLL